MPKQLSSFLSSRLIMDSKDEEEMKSFDLESFYRSCFIISKYSSLDFVAARRVEA
jgi:hypothetical protein